MTLAQAAPREFNGCEYEGTRARALSNVKVVKEHDSSLEPWPGREVNVHVWWTLANGKRVGWNESPSRGWSFPVLGKCR